MKEKITQQHIDTINKLFRSSNLTNLSKDQVEKILKEISKYIEYDEIIKLNNNFLPKTILHFFDLINNYYTAYTLSSEDYIKDRSNTLESLNKGNSKRQKRFNENKLSIEDKDINWTDRLIPFYENQILKLILDGKQKIAYLSLVMAFIYKDTFKSIFNEIFKFDKDYLIAIKKLDSSFNFFNFTYLKTPKVVTSSIILMYLYLKESTNLEDEQTLKLVRYISNYLYDKDAPSRIQENFFEREIYCAGIYNGLPIFQWHTSSIHDQYYTNEVIKEVEKLINISSDSIGILKYVIWGIFSRNLKKEDREKVLNPDKKLIKNLIENLPKTYLRNQQQKLYLKLINENPTARKPLKYYLYSPIRLVFTLFIAFQTKFVIK
jgi:hypothetical protein